MPGRIPCRFQLASEGGADLSGGAVHAGLAAGLRRPVVAADQRLQDRLVEAGVCGGPGGRAAQGIFGGQRGLQPGHARRRVDPGELRGEAGIFQRALPAGPVLGQQAGEVGEQRRAGMVGAVSEERQPFTQRRHGGIDGVGPVGRQEPGRPAQQAEIVPCRPVGHDDLRRIGVPAPLLTVPGRGEDLGSVLPAGDVAEHDLGQAGQEAKPQVAAVGLRHDEQLLAVAAGSGHGGNGRGGIAGQGQRDDDQRLRGQAAVPDPAQRPGAAGCGSLQAGEGGQQGHAAPPASVSLMFLAWRSARAMSAWSAEGWRMPLASASAVLIESRLPRSSRTTEPRTVSAPAARASSRQKPASSQVFRQRGWYRAGTASRALASSPRARV